LSAKKLISFLVAFQLLNVSIDTFDAERGMASGRGDYNHIDNYVEFVAEVIMKFKNAIPEPLHRTQKQMHHKLHRVVYDCIKTERVVFGLYAENGRQYFPDPVQYNGSFFNEISHPPEFS
jgi:hypothetical protein